MEIKPVEVYSEASNFGVVRMPGRNYPGCVIQGDSLFILFNRTRAAAQAVRSAGIDDPDVLGDLEDLCDSLLDRLLHYQEVLQQEGLDLPYVRPLSEADKVQLPPEEDESAT